jgi:hypothetical protein
LLNGGNTELSYFHKKPGLMKDALTRFHHESPSQRVSFLLHRELARYVAFLAEDYRLSNLVARFDPGLRAGAEGPYQDVWKLSSSTDGRYTWLWPRIEHDARLREHARAVWLEPHGLFIEKPIISAMGAMTMSKIRPAVAKILAHIGDVIFIRPPSARQLRLLEDSRIPRARGWDALLAAAKVKGIHADDVAAMKGLVIPEYSHLSRACAAVFTDAYVRQLAQLTPRVRLLPTAPPPLAPGNCVPAPINAKAQIAERQ